MHELISLRNHQSFGTQLNHQDVYANIIVLSVEKNNKSIASFFLLKDL